MRSKRWGVMFLIAFVDVLLAFVTIYMALNTIEMVAMNPQAVNTGNVKTDAQAMIELSWSDDCDFDLWVKDPNNNLVYFMYGDLGAGHLERDSMGTVNNYVPGGTGIAPHYKENWFMRQIIPGTYRVNIHLYSCRPKNDKVHSRTDPNEPVDATVSISIIRLNPTYSLVYEKDEHFVRSWEEMPVVKFDVDSNALFSKVEPNDELWVDDNIHYTPVRR